MPAALTSPGWPDNYPNKVVCAYYIGAEAGHRVVLNFLDFHIEPDCDFLIIANGLSLTDPILELSG